MSVVTNGEKIDFEFDEVTDITSTESTLSSEKANHHKNSCEPSRRKNIRCQGIMKDMTSQDDDVAMDPHQDELMSDGLREGDAPFPDAVSQDPSGEERKEQQPLHLPQMPSSPGVEDEDDEEGQPPPAEGSYDPADYEHLDVGPELKELFTYITRYTPQNIELDVRLRPYIPDYIPAVGDIDAFIKIPRPDNESSTIGLTVLDEPSARQSDPNLLDLQLRAVAKHTTARATVVKRVENGEKNTKVVEKWIKDISELHRAKPPPTVHYSKRMPDIDSLMQEWPGEVEDLLKELSLPSAALQLELPHYVDLICAILDIPVYKSRIQSLHVLFTLYSVFKSSAHFRHLAEENLMDNEHEETADRLVIQ